MGELGELGINAYEDQKPSIEDNFIDRDNLNDELLNPADQTAYFKKRHAALDNWSKRLQKLQGAHQRKARLNKRRKEKGLDEVKGLHLNHPRMYFQARKKLPWEKEYDNENQPSLKR